MCAKRVFAALSICAVLAGCGGGGGGGTSTPPPQATNTAPTIAVLASGQVKPGSAPADFTASVGAELTLSGATSSDAEGDALSFSWTLASKPAASTVQLASGTDPAITFVPDAQGNYQLSLRVTDSRGAFTDRSIAVLVDNTAPLPVVVISAVYSVTPTVRPPQEISIGAIIVLDASGSTDPDGDPVTTTWTIVDHPAGSTAALTVQGQTARFVADVPGRFQIMARGQDPIGAYSETVYVLDATNHAPNAVLIGNVTTNPRNSGQQTLTASVGYTVVLDGTNSSDPDGDSLTRSWSMVSRPAGSTATLSAAAGTSTQLVPDVLGAYQVRLTATDPGGASATYTVTVNVNNTRPNAAITTNTTPIALPTGPSVRVPVGTELTLRGTGSNDADGDVIVYAWSVVTAPLGSTAALTTPTAATTKFTPDFAGSYVLRLRVTDPAGAFSDRLLNIDIGNYPPVAVTDRTRVTVVAGTTVHASAAQSFDEDGDPITYSWALDARPAGSTATIAAPGNAALSFVPDVAGTYIASVTVDDGTAVNVASVIVRALASVASSVTLPFAPLDARYSKGLDKLVIISAAPNTLRIVDPFTGVIQNVALPLAVKSFGLNPDGTLAAVLHEGLVSLVDLQTAQLVRTSSTAGSQTDVFLLNDATAYLIGQSGGQWVTPPITVIDTRTGVATTQSPPGFAFFYGLQTGVLADRKNKVLFVAQGLSPADISWFTIDPAAHTAVQSGDSQYHGDWPIGATLYLSDTQDLVFTSAGNYFNTETLIYGGSLGLVGGMLSFSHSATADEALVLQTSVSGFFGPEVYNDHYARFFGSLFLPDNDIPLPTVGGQQSYGIKIFHSGDDRHVILVQTGSAEALAPGIQYHVINR